MSDYCKGCHYQKKLRTGERACPYNALYWDFFARNAPALAGNHRLSMVYQQLRRMPAAETAALQAHAATIRAGLDSL
jgi:deoxyribodipyrimidine photolyase-related protein